MSYHAKALAAMRRPRAVARGQPLAAAETRAGRGFPASVKEWYEALNGRDLLAKYSRADRVIDPADFNIVTVAEKTLVPVLVENQDLCWWGFELDGSDDPPVYVSFDPLPGLPFAYSRTFSEFTYLRVFDFDGGGARAHSLVEHKAPLRDSTLQWLESTLTSEPKSLGWPASITYRYSCHLGRIAIRQSRRQAEWVLSAASARALEQLKGFVDHAW